MIETVKEVQKYSLETRGINDLRGHDFRIPAYQRGYRWTRDEVTKLLDDLYNFGIKEAHKKSYCLQPLVVYPLEGDKRFEVIDGQQRLTTLFILLNFLMPGSELYSITYETRTSSQDYIKNIKDNLSKAKDYIDYYFMAEAYSTIEQWVEAKESEKFGAKNKIISILSEKVDFIWYEVNSTPHERMDVFNRLNVGKIPLTNAELIKALLLRDGNFPVVDDDRSQVEINIKQRNSTKFLMASQWDAMERELHDDELWSFLNGRDKSVANRIELILRVFAELDGCTADQEYSVFDYYDQRLSKENEAHVEAWNSEKLWGELQSLFLTMKEWFRHPEIFHFAGYIVAYKVNKLTLKDILKLAKEKLKSAFVAKLRNVIADDLLKKSSMKMEEILEWSYENESEKVEKVLALFNIGAVLLQSGSSERISFHYLNGERMSLEHIHAQNSEHLTTKEQWKTWLKDHRESLAIIKHESVRKDECVNLIIKIDEILSRDFDSKDFRIDDCRPVFDAVVQFFSGQNLGISIHDIGNLALLDRDNNSSLSNSVFEVKGRLLKKKMSEGQYLLPGTRNVFLKYYTDSPENLHYWSEKDMVDYRESIVSTLNTLLGGQ